MNKKLSRLLIAIEVLILAGILVVGFLGGLGELGSRLWSTMTQKEQASIQTNSETLSVNDSGETEKKTDPKADADPKAELTENPETVQAADVSQETQEETDVPETAEEIASAASTEAVSAEETEEAAETEIETETEEEALVKASYQEEKIQFSDTVEAAIAGMTTRQLVGQLFLISPETLVGLTSVRLAGDSTYAAIMERPVFGLMYSKANFTDQDQMMTMLSNTQGFSQTASGVSMMMGITEVGGADGSAIAELMGVDAVETASNLIAGGADAVEQAAAAKASYLKEAGFSLVFATNCEGTIDLDTMKAKVTADLTGIQSAGLVDVVRTFPWNNDKESSETFAELMANEISVFQTAVDAGAKVIMVSNTIVPEISGDLPCTLSSGTVDVLRGNLGYEGVLMTESLCDVRITDNYSEPEAAVDAIVAGMDLIFNPSDFNNSYDQVLAAVEDGTISETRLHNAVGRVLSLKLDS